MKAENFQLDMLLKMRHSSVSNYVIPGLTSSMIGEKSANGLVRLFECDRDHQEVITPHSHRFDFQCWVLAGSVTNRIWKEKNFHEFGGDLYEISELRLDTVGSFGKYKTYPVRRARFDYRDITYAAGECYSMKAKEIHSIKFSRGTKVLFFEGPVIDSSIIIEPVVDGEVIRTFQVLPWMFKRG